MKCLNSKCLRCDKEVEDYWFSFGIPGKYCSPCMEIVVIEHPYLLRLLDLMEHNLVEMVKQHRDQA